MFDDHSQIEVMGKMKSLVLKSAIASTLTIGAAFAGAAEAQVTFNGASSNWSNSTCSPAIFGPTRCNVHENVSFAGFNTVQYGTRPDSRIGFKDNGPTTAGFGEFFRIGTFGIFNTADTNNILNTADLNLTLDFTAPDGLVAGLDFVANVSQNGLLPDSLDITPQVDSLITTASSGKKYKVTVGFAGVPIKGDFLDPKTRGVFAKVETVPEPATMFGLGVVAAGLLAQKRLRKTIS